MKKLLRILFALIAITLISCTDMTIASGTPQVSTGVVVGYGYPVYVPRYPVYNIYRSHSVYALPPKEYWYHPSWKVPLPPKKGPMPPKYVPTKKSSQGYGNQVRRPDTRGPRTFNRNRH